MWPPISASGMRLWSGWAIYLTPSSNRIGDGQLTFPAGLLELPPGSLYVALHQSFDDTKAVGSSLCLPGPSRCPGPCSCPSPWVGLKREDRRVREMLCPQPSSNYVQLWQQKTKEKSVQTFLSLEAADLDCGISPSHNGVLGSRRPKVRENLTERTRGWR